jgi:two-component system cell cycle sensor histidine kinase/response regulator CckA
VSKLTIKKFAKKLSSVRLQLVGSVFVAIVPVLVLTYIVNQPWFWQFSPPWARDYFVNVPWVSLTVGLFALVAAWLGGEFFILRQVRALSDAAQRLGTGNLGSRTGLKNCGGELGALAEVFDGMAEALQERVGELETAHQEMQKLAISTQKLAAFAEWNPKPTLELEPGGELTYFNEATLKLARSVNKSHPRDVLPLNIGEIVSDCLEVGRSQLHIETKLDGRTFSWSFHPMLATRVVHGYVEDMTERLSLEAQLRQAQKMESVGQLAAGVAHDFNNLLAIIQGHSSALLARPNLPEDIRDPIQAACLATERAASLTRQLLMFSRKNTMQPRPLDLRETVGSMTKTLQRLIGENISLKFNPPEELPIILGDSGMMEQVLTNLSVNARDAMQGEGVLTIGLATVNLDKNYCNTHAESHVGSFVRLSVTDTGVGMNAAMLARLFEPFFTTKEIGKGTGLGLATVYGIVKQHDGWVEVSSNPGLGTTFNVFFPAGNGMATTAEREIISETGASGGTETIFIVEDEPSLREIARTILECSGYRILEASSGKDALNVWNQSSSRIDLLLTDMVMPGGVSGMELAGHLQTLQPGLKIVFTTGYSAHEISSEMLARTQADFLQKPYSHDELTKIVRDCLDKKSPAGSANVEA